MSRCFDEHIVSNTGGQRKTFKKRKYIQGYEDMEISKTLQPGDMGTKQYLNKYGNKLVCVRYRIDRRTQKRYTTIELVVNEREIISQHRTIIAWVKIHYRETELRQSIRENGGRWLVNEKVWAISYDIASKLGLKNRIVKRLVNEDD